MPVYLMGAGLKGTVLYILPIIIKGIVHPNMNITLFFTLFTCSYDVLNLFQCIYCAEHKIRYVGESG